MATTKMNGGAIPMQGGGPPADGSLGGGPPADGSLGGGPPADGSLGGGPPADGSLGGSGPGNTVLKVVHALGPLVVAHRKLHFKIQQQEQTEWCWAAVAVSVEKFFDKDSKLKQCKVANKLFHKQNNECCEDPDTYNDPEELEIALQKIHKWRNTLSGPLTFEQVQREIDNNRPVCVGITWYSGGGHFVVVRGYRLLASGAQQLYVADPENPSNLVDFNEFTVAYYGEGTWTETDFVASDWL